MSQSDFVATWMVLKPMSEDDEVWVRADSIITMRRKHNHASGGEYTHLTLDSGETVAVQEAIEEIVAGLIGEDEPEVYS